MPDPRPPRPLRRTRSGPTRRQMLQRAALLSLGAPTLGAFLDACTRSSGAPSTPSGSLTLAAPTHPVTWPISKDNAPIGNGLSPERNATLRLYNYADYIGPGVIKQFEKKYASYGVNVTVSTFNDTDEAITKIRTGDVPYDIYFPSYDQSSRLVAAGLIRPLNHSYITNIDNLWAAFKDPWYDQQWRYTVPYSVYTTGIGWRVDKVSTDISALPNPYDTLWDAKYRGHTAMIDDWHTCMGMCLLRAGKTDLNTDSPADLALIHQQLTELSNTTKPKVTISMYTDLPGGQLGQCQVVRRCGECAVLPPERHVGRRSAVLVPERRQGHGGQRPHGRAFRRAEPGPGAPVPPAHARHEGGVAELRLHRLSTAATLSRHENPRSAGIRPEEPRRGGRSRGVLQRRLPAARTDGRQRRRLAPHLAILQGRQLTGGVDRVAVPAPPTRHRNAALAAVVATRPGVVMPVLPRAALRRPRDRLRHGRPTVSHPCSGVEPTRLERRPVSLRAGPHLRC